MSDRYEVRVQGRFSAVHQLKMYDGSLEPLHGHDWRVEVVFRGDRLDEAGLLIDFEEASRVLEELLAELHHGNLNSHRWLEGQNPSAEQVARVLFQEFRARLGQDRPLAAVYVEEAPGCVAGYLA